MVTDVVYVSSYVCSIALKQSVRIDQKNVSSLNLTLDVVFVTVSTFARLLKSISSNFLHT